MLHFKHFGFCTQQYETLSGHNPVNCSTRARLNTWMQSFRAWQGLFQFNSGANLLINIIEGPRKFSGDFATEYSGCFWTRLPKGTPFGAWAKFLDVHNFCYGSPFQAHKLSKRSYRRRVHFQHFGFCTQQYETLSGHNPVNSLTRGFEWMDAVVWAWEGLSSGYFGCKP